MPVLQGRHRPWGNVLAYSPVQHVECPLPDGAPALTKIFSINFLCNFYSSLLSVSMKVLKNRETFSREHRAAILDFCQFYLHVILHKVSLRKNDFFFSPIILFYFWPLTFYIWRPFWTRWLPKSDLEKELAWRTA